MEVINKELGSELDLVVSIEKGIAVIALVYGGELASANLTVKVPAAKLVQKIADAIPGQIDDIILKALLLAVR